MSLILLIVLSEREGGGKGHTGVATVTEEENGDRRLSMAKYMSDTLRLNGEETVCFFVN